MNRIVALFTYHKRLSMLRNHSDFPFAFAFQVLDFIHMVDFVAFTVRRSAQLAYMRFQAFFKRRSRIAVNKRRVADNIRRVRRSLAFGVFDKVATFASRLCFIRDAPTPFAVFEFSLDFGDRAFVFRRERLQAAVFHEIAEVTQLIEIASHSIVVADSPQFGVVDGDNLQIRQV